MMDVAESETFISCTVLNKPLTVFDQSPSKYSTMALSDLYLPKTIKNLVKGLI